MFVFGRCYLYKLCKDRKSQQALWSPHLCKACIERAAKYSWVPLKLDILGAWKSVQLKHYLAYPIIIISLIIQRNLATKIWVKCELGLTAIWLKQDPSVQTHKWKLHSDTNHVCLTCCNAGRPRLNETWQQTKQLESRGILRPNEKTSENFIETLNHGNIINYTWIKNTWEQ